MNRNETTNEILTEHFGQDSLIAFAAWYDNGHINEANPNACLLEIKLTDGVLFSKGVQYDIDFT